MTVAVNLLKQALELTKDKPAIYGSMISSDLSLLETIREYRNIGLQLPRRTGKSIAVQWLNRQTSSLLFSKYMMNKKFDYKNLESIYRGCRSNGLKYQYIILDEYPEWPQDLHLFIQQLAVADMLTADFCVVRLYT